MMPEIQNMRQKLRMSDILQEDTDLHFGQLYNTLGSDQFRNNHPSYEENENSIQY